MNPSRLKVTIGGNSLLRVSDLIVAGKKPLVRVPPRTTVREALVQMAELKYSQLAIVVDSSVEIIKAANLGQKVALHGSQVLDSQVDGHSQPVHMASPDDVLQLWYEDLLENEYLIVDGDPKHIITAWDLADFLFRTSRDFSTVGEIEVALREVVRLEVGARAVTDEDRPLLEETTIRGLRSWILSDECWPRVRHRFRDKGRVEAELADLGEIRDQICHFQGELTPEQRFRLAEIHEWARSVGTLP
jgi:CBS domain-containing protein